MLWPYRALANARRALCACWRGVLRRHPLSTPVRLSADLSGSCRQSHPERESKCVRSVAVPRNQSLQQDSADRRSILAGEALLGGDGLHVREIHFAIRTRGVLGPGCAIRSSNRFPVCGQGQIVGVDRRPQVFSVITFLVAEALNGQPWFLGCGLVHVAYADPGNRKGVFGQAEQIDDGLRLAANGSDG